MNAMQEKLLEMLDWFHSFCVSNNIRYYIIGGTLLGAMRHGGFIPWDDDVDVAVPMGDYERLCALLAERRGHYIIETAFGGRDDYVCNYAKLYDTDTTLVEHAKRECRRGVYLDIFPLGGIGDTQEEAQRNYRGYLWLSRFLSTRTSAVRKERAWYKNAAIVLASLIPGFMARENRTAQRLERMAEKMSRGDAKYVITFASAYELREIMPREVYGTPAEYTFEGRRFFGPAEPEEYLRRLYGDWRQLPPPEERTSGHDIAELRLDRSYLQ